MGGLLQKDFLLLRDIGKQFTFIFIFFAICDYLSSGDFGFCRTFGTVAVLITCVNLISYDEYYHWDKYSFALPVSRRQLVQVKYIMFLLLATLVSALILVLELFLQENGWQAAVVTIGTLYAFNLVCIALVIPLVYRFTARKALLVTVGAIGGVTAAIAAIFVSYLNLVGQENAVGQLENIFNNYLALLVVGVIALVSILLFISYQISVRLVEKKTF